MFEFDNEEDRNQIFYMSPWSVQGHCLSMKRWMSSIGLDQVAFERFQFWVQVHDLSYEKFSDETARMIGNSIENLIEIEEKVESTQKTYIRMKVEVKVDELLMTGFWWTNSR